MWHDFQQRLWRKIEEGGHFTIKLYRYTCPWKLLNMLVWHEIWSSFKTLHGPRIMKQTLWLKSKFVHCHIVLWLKTLKKWSAIKRCRYVTLIVTNFKRNFMKFGLKSKNASRPQGLDSLRQWSSSSQTTVWSTQASSNSNGENQCESHVGYRRWIKWTLKKIGKNMSSLPVGVL